MPLQAVSNSERIACRANRPPSCKEDAVKGQDSLTLVGSSAWTRLP